MLSEPEVPEEFYCTGTVEAKYAPGGLREVLDLNACEGGVPTENFVSGSGAFGFSVDEDLSVRLENTQVSLDAPFRVQQRGVGAEVILFRHHVREDSVEHLCRVLAGESEQDPIRVVYEGRFFYERLIAGAVEGGLRLQVSEILHMYHMYIL